ncbi:MAG: 4-hydroxyphenylacetate 3-hydroxylase N-terminal domain-containing protein [Lacisediminimonas sp.]|nr:4-hydroxyphenylacetate 3-hydroxylase N-terminal domain-containing protein [Lacisediminimonas sp.]
MVKTNFEELVASGATGTMEGNFMLRTGAQHLESLRDGRVVYIGNERVEDVTTHPAFREAAKTVAHLFDMKADPTRTDLWYEEEGERYAMYYLRPKTREDLKARTMAHLRIAEATLGMFGRSPDHVPSYITGMTAHPEIFDEGRKGFGQNLLNYYDYLRKNDLYASYAVLPPQAMRNPELFQRENRPVPSLRVVREDDDGVVITGMKMLATGAVLANEIWIGNILPLAKDQLAESITCAVPVNVKGLSLWSRRPIATAVTHPSEAPLSWRYDETDSMVLCEEVKVPWEKVFVHQNAELAKDIYVRTPGHSFSNHQSGVRFWAKVGFLVGLASRITQATGADKIPAVQDTLGRLAALEASIGSMVMGQIENYEDWGPGGTFKGYNRRGVYAVSNWCYEHYSPMIDIIRELCGGGVYQLPADNSVLDDPKLRETFETYWYTPQLDAVARMKLFRLAWDITGSEFASRHLSYEKAYLGAHFVVRNLNFKVAPWEKFHKIVDDILERDD